MEDFWHPSPRQCETTGNRLASVDFTAPDKILVCFFQGNIWVSRPLASKVWALKSDGWQEKESKKVARNVNSSFQNVDIGLCWFKVSAKKFCDGRTICIKQQLSLLPRATCQQWASAQCRPNCQLLLFSWPTSSSSSSAASAASPQAPS